MRKMATIFKSKSLFVLCVFIAFCAGLMAQQPTIEWVSIPAGSFIMGSPKTEKNHMGRELQQNVSLSAFEMSKYEITIGQFKAFVDATAYVTDAEKESSDAVVHGVTINGVFTPYQWRMTSTGKFATEEDYNLPVVHVSWADANAFAQWMGCRLPTEAEWEYACRAGTSGPFSTGDNISTQQANYDGQFPYNAKKNKLGIKRHGASAVGSFAPNPWGLFDMHGNVFEWCSDNYGKHAAEAQTNPTGPAHGAAYVLKGGSWMSFGLQCRSAYGFPGAPHAHFTDVGIRLVRVN